jgi:hypothetical protein
LLRNPRGSIGYLLGETVHFDDGKDRISHLTLRFRPNTKTSPLGVSLFLPENRQYPYETRRVSVST